MCVVYSMSKTNQSQFSIMKPLHNHHCCLFLSVLFAQVHFLSATNGNLTVLQSSYLSVTKGENATIQCSWKGSLNQLSVHWLKNGTKFWGDVKRTNISVLVIHNVSSEDSGLYVCKVIQEIPTLRSNLGAGTQLTVNSETNPPTTPKIENDGEHGFTFTVTVSLAVVVGLLVTCVPLGIWRIKRTGQRLENQVIRETPIDSEEPRNMDEHGEEVDSNSSRGSTQWCQVPVYEAYFDHRRDGEDG